MQRLRFTMIRLKVQKRLQRINPQKNTKWHFECTNPALYDACLLYTSILNPEIYKERVEEFLSLLLRQNVKILEVLPNEETGLSDGYSILIMDIVVELENGSIVNLSLIHISIIPPTMKIRHFQTGRMSISSSVNSTSSVIRLSFICFLRAVLAAWIIHRRYPTKMIRRITPSTCPSVMPKYPRNISRMAQRMESGNSFCNVSFLIVSGANKMCIRDRA